MAIKEKTISDFNKLVIEAKQKFLQDKINYGWEYTIKEEKFDTMEVFWICNIQNAKKIVFFNEQNYLSDNTIYMNDVRILSEMKEKL